MGRWANKYVIGLTGNIAMGKSVVRKMLEHLGAYTIDADSLAHQTMVPGAPAYHPIIDTFGRWILDLDGRINRTKLGAVAFSHPDALARLEAITHPVVGQGVDSLISRAKQPVAVVEAIKLLESPLGGQVDAIWVVDAAAQMQIDRLVQRRAMPDAEARRRVATQNPQREKLARADVVITNNGSLQDIWVQVEREWKRLVAAHGIQESEDDQVRTVKISRQAQTAPAVRPPTGGVQTPATPRATGSMPATTSPRATGSMPAAQPPSSTRTATVPAAPVPQQPSSKPIPVPQQPSSKPVPVPQARPAQPSASTPAPAATQPPKPAAAPATQPKLPVKTPPPTPAPGAAQPMTAPAARPPESRPVPTPGITEEISISIRRGMPRTAESIARLINQTTGKNLTRMDIMGLFGEKSYLMAEMSGSIMGLAGFQVENLITRVDEFIVIPEAPVAPISDALIQSVEDASKALQSEVGFVYLPLNTPPSLIQVFLGSGYERTELDAIKVPAWREAAAESQPPNTLILAKKLRAERVLKPL